MVNRINRLLDKKKGRILSVYFTAGFPSLHDTLPILKSLERAGADMVEIGMPFSDPLADGPVIQRSSVQAIHNGMTIPVLLEQLRNVRNHVSMPLVLMGYINPVLQYGVERFITDAAAVGIDGFILPDLPLKEYLRDYEPLVSRLGLRNIFLITPQTSEDRIREIDAHSGGFIYMVSSASTTGTKSGTARSQFGYFDKINALNLANPRLIGFGIKDKESFDIACRYASGAIIGSAFIRHLEQHASRVEAATEEFVQSIIR